MVAIDRVYPLGGAPRCDHGLCHCHRLQHLVLDTSRDPQRRDHDSRRHDPTADIIHSADHDRAIPAIELLHPVDRRSPDYCKARVGKANTNLRHHLIAKALHGLNIWLIVHLAGKQDQWSAFFKALGLHVGCAIEFQIDPVAHGTNAVMRQSRAHTEELGLGFTDEQTMIGSFGDVFLERSQQVPFPAVDPGHGSRAIFSIAFKLRAIDIAKIHNNPAAEFCGDILRHLTGKDEDTIDRSRGDDTGDIGADFRIVETCERNRFSGHHRFYSTQPFGFAS